MNDVHSVNIFSLTLKSRDDFAAAFDAIISTKLSDYLKMFLTPQPGDWPAQFYSRQIVYESILKFCKPSDVPDNTASSHLHVDHFYTTVGSSGPGAHNTKHTHKY